MLSNGSFVYGMLISLGLGSAELTADGSGRYLIESFNLGTPTGWVARGRYHYLRQGNVPSSAW
jgi:hypothetical protein